ncbi:hypothetical protein OURE66S_00660 [Oligella ureolytica]
MKKFFNLKLSALAVSALVATSATGQTAIKCGSYAGSGC